MGVCAQSAEGLTVVGVEDGAVWTRVCCDYCEAVRWMIWNSVNVTLGASSAMGSVMRQSQDDIRVCKGPLPCIMLRF
jgi:hypothetical protein